MKKILQNRMVVTIVWISLILILVLVGFHLYINYLYEPMEAKIAGIKIKRVEETKFNQEEWMKEYKLSFEEADNILRNPQDYRFIMYQCERENTSSFLHTNLAKYQPLYSTEMKARALYTEGYFLHHDLYSKEDSNELIRVLVKLEEGDDDKKLIEIAKKDRFLIIGYKVTGGKFSTEAKYEGE